MQAPTIDRANFGAPVRYRPVPGEKWLTGEIVEIKGLDLMFVCDAPLELHTELEIVLPAKVQAMACELSLNLCCTARVTRRILVNWPDSRPALVISIINSRIAH